MKDDVTLVSAVRRSPVQMGLFALGPVALACAQLLNSLVAGLSLWVSASFAALMVAYAVLYTRYHLAQLRLRDLEGGVPSPTAD